MSKSDGVKLTYTSVGVTQPPRAKSRVCRNGHVVTQDVRVMAKSGDGKMRETCGICRENARQRHYKRTGHQRVTRAQG